MKKKILIPTDFSFCSWNAINYALELYKDELCEFYILNTFRETGYTLESMMVPEPGDALYELVKKTSEKGLEKVKNQIKSTKGENPKHDFKFISKFNFLLEAMLFFVDQHDISMIIMGTKGMTNSSKVLYGSNAIDAMEKIRSCPVLAIPKNAGIKLPKEIVFPTDFKIPIKRNEILPLIEIAKKTDSQIRLLHVVESLDSQLNSDQVYNKSLFKEYLKDINYVFHTIENDDRIAGINCYVESRESNMVTFINKKHTFFGSILSRPLVKNLGYYSNVPVLAFHYVKN